MGCAAFLDWNRSGGGPYQHGKFISKALHDVDFCTGHSLGVVVILDVLSTDSLAISPGSSGTLHGISGVLHWFTGSSGANGRCQSEFCVALAKKRWGDFGTTDSDS